MSDDEKQLAEQNARAAQRARNSVGDARRAFRAQPAGGGGVPESAARVNESMSRLAEAFDVLEGRPGVRPWDIDQLHTHALLDGTSESTRHAIRFVLDVFNSQAIDVLDREADKELGHFRSVEALAGWDAGNRAAFVAWASAPWWP